MKTTALMIACSVPLLAACETVESKNVNTDGIYADMRATARGTGSTHVEVSLRVGGSGSNTYLDLSEGDELTLHQGGVERRLERDPDVFGAVRYETDLSTDAAGTLMRVAFTRKAHEMDDAACRGESAPYSIASLPQPIRYLGPAADTRFSRADDDLEITWEPAGDHDALTWSLSGLCVRDLGGELSGDPGRLTIDAGDIVPLSEQQMGDTCSVTVTLRRARTGEIDPAYGEGGRFVAEQIRTLDLQSAP